MSNFGRTRADDEIVKLAYSVHWGVTLLMFPACSAYSVITINMSGRLKTLSHIGCALVMTQLSVKPYLYEFVKVSLCKTACYGCSTRTFSLFGPCLQSLHGLVLNYLALIIHRSE